MELQFLGATGTVTGSKYLLTHKSSRILVDCGLFQGYKQLRLRNWDPLPVAPSRIDAVVLTHAHLDHSGYLPLLVRGGFRGRIFCTAATYALCRILLPDSGRLQEEDAEHANRHGYSKHHPAQPLYTEDDAFNALKHFAPVDFHAPFDVGQGIHVTLVPAGHILGAAIAQLTCAGITVTFSGDLGRPHDPIIVAPAIVERSDYLVIESTYGNRVHLRTDPLILLGSVIRETAERGGVVVIPAFAVGRAQEIMFYIHQLKESGAIPKQLPIYLNSPMARDATDIYQRHHAEHRLSAAQCDAVCRGVRIVNSVEESKALNRKQMPMVIIAASGMATGGRVLYHLEAFGPDPRNTILFAGYQAGGTRGAALVGGAGEVKIHGAYVPIRAQVAQIENLSAHADSDELIAWLSNFAAPPRKVFITHGEPDASDALRKRIEAMAGWACHIPDYRESVTLD